MRDNKFEPGQVSLVYRNTSPTNYMEFTIFVLFLLKTNEIFLPIFYLNHFILLKYLNTVSQQSACNFKFITHQALSWVSSTIDQKANFIIISYMFLAF